MTLSFPVDINTITLPSITFRVEITSHDKIDPISEDEPKIHIYKISSKLVERFSKLALDEHRNTGLLHKHKMLIYI